MTDSNPLASRLATLRHAYVRSLPERAVSLRAGCSELVAAPANGDRIRQLRLLAHQLAGSGGAYGFPDISTSARTLEQLLLALDSATGSGEVLDAVVRATTDLCLLLDRHGEAPQSPPKRL